MKRLTIIFSGILLIGFVFEYWLLYFSGLIIPEHIPYTPINIGGLLILISMLTTLIIFIKKLHRQNSSLSVFRMTLLGSIVCLIAEFIFQLIKLATNNYDALKDRVIESGAGVISITFFGAILSFFVAYQIRTRRTRILLLFIILFIAIFLFVK